MTMPNEIQDAAAGLLKGLLKELITNQKRNVSLDQQLWDVDDIAHYFHMSKHYTQYNIITQPTFPPIRPVPTNKDGDRISQFWKASDIIEWAMAIDKTQCSFGSINRKF